MMSLVIPSTILIIKEEEKLYIEIYHLNKDIIDTNYVFFLNTQVKVSSNVSIKKKAFYIKVTI